MLVVGTVLTVVIALVVVRIGLPVVSAIAEAQLRARRATDTYDPAARVKITHRKVRFEPLEIASNGLSWPSEAGRDDAYVDKLRWPSTTWEDEVFGKHAATSTAIRALEAIEQTRTDAVAAQRLRMAEAAHRLDAPNRSAAGDPRPDRARSAPIGADFPSAGARPTKAPVRTPPRAAAQPARPAAPARPAQPASPTAPSAPAVEITPEQVAALVRKEGLADAVRILRARTGLDADAITELLLRTTPKP